MNVLLIGSGGREHALAWKLAQSPQLERLWCAPGNAGISDVAECIDLDVASHHAVIDFCNANEITLVVVGPEQPLVDGLVDTLASAGILAFGPSAKAARLEGSKGFTKDLCAEYNIPTAAYQRFDNSQEAITFAKSHPMPVVIKADGLAAGKGVIIAENSSDAQNAVEDCFAGEFGAAGAEVVIEEFLSGEEASIFFLCDGETALPFGTAQDHKRVGEGDTGPNTGGMGAYSPAPMMSDVLIQRSIDEIIEPTLRGMLAKGASFKGVLYAGLMIDDAGPKLIEYNVRFGDPECQVLMMRLESDLLPLLLASAEGHLSDAEVKWSNKAALTVVLASKGYPGAYEKGTVITGVDQVDDRQHHVFHAGTALKNDQITATGGRVLNVTALGKTVREAQLHAYTAVDQIDWPQGFCRRDIGWRAINHTDDNTH